MGCEQIGDGRSGTCEADSRCGTGVSVGLKRDQDEGRVSGGGWSAAGALRKSWEKKYERRAEVEVGSSAGFILDVRLAKPWPRRGRVAGGRWSGRRIGGSDLPIRTHGFLLRNHQHVNNYY